MNYHPSWPKPAVKSFEESISAHGGWENWENFSLVRLRLLSFTGFLPFVKGLGRTFQAPREIIVDPKERRSEFDYGSHRDIFLDGRLIFSSEGTEIRDGRSIFKKLNFETWTPQHSLYFFGYAWANYIGYPFILPRFELTAWGKHRNDMWYRINFPDGFHTHSRSQTFYFGRGRLLERHDYLAEYAGSLFHAAHFTEGYQEKDGLQFSCIRRVRPRLGPMALPLQGIYAELGLYT